MKKSEYYFVLKRGIEDFFPCRIIKQHNNSCFEIENLETGAKENLIDGKHYKTEIDVRFEKRAQQINSFIEKKGVVLHPFLPPLGEDNSSLSLEIFIFLTRKDDIKNLEEKFNNEWNEYFKEVENCRIEKNIKWKELGERLKALNCVFTIEDLFEVLKKKYNIILSSEEKRNIILKLDKPKKIK